MQAANVVAEMDAAGVARAVAVATSTPTTEIALDAARQYPDRFGAMGSLAAGPPGEPGTAWLLARASRDARHQAELPAVAAAFLAAGRQRRLVRPAAALAAYR